MSLNISSIIPCGNSYVVRGLTEGKPVEHKFVDQYGRTIEDQQFLEDFEKLCSAAYLGNLQSCKKIIEAGFHDFKAAGFGKKFTDYLPNLQQGEGVTPLKIAQQQKHSEIIKLFQQKIREQEPPEEDDQILQSLRNKFGSRVSEITKEVPLFSNELSPKKSDLKKELKVTSRTLYDKMNEGISDEELIALVDQVQITEGEKTNPLNALLQYGVQKNPEKAVREIAKKYFVTENHLERAIIQGYSSETLQVLLEQALIHDENIDTKNCIYWLFEKRRDYSDELFFHFISHANETEHRYVLEAFKTENLSDKTLELFLIKAKELHPTLTVILFPNNMSEFFFKKSKEFREQKEEAFTKTGLMKYWHSFKDKPKPYLPYQTRFSDSLIKKVIDKSSSIFGLGDLIGSATEEVLDYLLSKNPDWELNPLDFEHILLCGYSEDFVLKVCDRLEKEDVEDSMIEIAKIRNYSQEVIQKLQEKNASSCSIL